jgi:dihydropyrimidine dehydrogenase (NAD+) subunit PreT
VSATSFKLPVGRLEERFEESKPLYTPAEAMAEANRCLYCADAPCIKACPTDIDIPTFIRKIATDNVLGSAKTILDSNLLGDSCGRVCPVEVLCAGDCVYNAWNRPPINIGRLQRYATETVLTRQPLHTLYKAKAPTGKRIAFVGAGPASVAAAGLLALEGHRAVIFERKSVPGGLNSLGIAPYKMLGSIALQEIERILSLGDIELRTGVEVTTEASSPRQVSPAALLAEYDAVFLGLGLGADSKLGIPGEDGPGVYGATDLIELIKSDAGFRLGVRQQRALIVGGGNTAIDIAHELALLGVQEVAMVYRRGAKEMSGYHHEMDYARRHGVRLIEHRQPHAVIRHEQGHVTGLQVLPTNEVLAADLIAVAIGQNRMTVLAKSFEGVAVDTRGRVVVDPVTHRTGNPKVWSGGDCVNGGKEVVNAVQEAKRAVQDIQRALMGN